MHNIFTYAVNAVKVSSNPSSSCLSSLTLSVAAFRDYFLRLFECASWTGTWDTRMEMGMHARQVRQRRHFAACHRHSWPADHDVLTCTYLLTGRRNNATLSPTWWRLCERGVRRAGIRCAFALRFCAPRFYPISLELARIYLNSEYC